MSSNRGRGRGRGNRPHDTLEAPEQLASQDFNPPMPNVVPEQPARQRRAQPKSADELRRVMDIIQSRISVIIDSLEGDDNELSLKRNVATAVKHLKQINALLE